jgi:allophanate hydrolase
MSPIRPLTLDDYQAAYAAGATPRELLSARWRELLSLGCGPEGDPAFIAIASAEQLEAQLAAIEQADPKDLPLLGIPFVVKDNIDVAGWPTTAALPSRNALAERSAPVVEALQRAGAVLLAKTNLDQFATGLVGTRSPYGWVPNPLSPAHVSGGSSSGSASAVARGLACFSLGTDTAGSGRVPAAFCNLVGLKPTPGLFSTTGVLPACASLDCVSVFALTVADAARILPVMADPAGRPANEVRHHRLPPERLAFGRRARVGVPVRPHFDDSDYEAPWQDAVKRLRELGHEVVEVDIEVLHQVAALLYDGPWVAERYWVAGKLIEARAPGLDPAVTQVIGKARGLSAVDAFDGLYRLRSAEARARAIWDRCDLLMLPTAPGMPTHEAVMADPVGRNAALGRYTNAVNLLGWAALALPAGWTARDLPFGVSFISAGGSDAALIDFGSRWDDLRGGRALGAQRSRLAHQVADRAVLAPFGPTPSAPFDLPARLAAEPLMPIAVVGAHLEGMPLHHQVLAAGARLLARTRTAPCYRLYALAGGPPARPGLARVAPALAALRNAAGGAEAAPAASVAGGGAAIEVEVYGFPAHAVGGFLAQIPPPLGLGSLELEDGRWIKGFICEPWGLEGARDITASGGWRYHLRGLPQRSVPSDSVSQT